MRDVGVEGAWSQVPGDRACMNLEDAPLLVGLIIQDSQPVLLLSLLSL